MWAAFLFVVVVLLFLFITRIVLGTLLFTLCDLAIGARIVLIGRRKQVMGVLVWVFYLPALALLAWTAP
ncbi:MAG: hypothetical protein IPI35_34040 [Deltaproteobacteria bacterium]|nr:hypothetical protein [Deltaproteobacteria bacterium]